MYNVSYIKDIIVLIVILSIICDFYIGKCDGIRSVIKKALLLKKSIWHKAIPDQNSENENIINKKKSLLSNYPNPFNPSTIISFDIPNKSNIEVIIYNIKGQKVKTLIKDSYFRGQYKVIWNGEDDNGTRVSSGVYFYMLKVNGKLNSVKKMLLLK